MAVKTIAIDHSSDTISVIVNGSHYTMAVDHGSHTGSLIVNGGH